MKQSQQRNHGEVFVATVRRAEPGLRRVEGAFRLTRHPTGAS